jgi:hypothetical protein
MRKLNRKQKAHYGLTILCILLLRFLDLYITFRYTPNLKGEWNPVVSLFGASWTGLIIFQVSLVLFISVIVYYYFAREIFSIPEKDLSYPDFIYCYFFGKLVPWPKRLFTAPFFPKNIARHLAFQGHLLMMLAIFISVFAIVHNLLLLTSVQWYIEFVMTHYKGYLPSVFIIATLLAFNLFFIREYLRYRKNQTP